MRPGDCLVRLYACAAALLIDSRCSSGCFMHRLRTVRNKTHNTEALVLACSAWAIRGSKQSTNMLFWKDVGNRILLDRPLPFKLHQIPTATVFYSRVARNLVRSANSAVMTVMTSTQQSASHYRGNAVIVTALSTFIKCTLGFVV